MSDVNRSQMVCSSKDGKQNLFFFKLGQLQPSHWGEHSRDGRSRDCIWREKQKIASCLMNDVQVGAELFGKGKGTSVQAGV